MCARMGSASQVAMNASSLGAPPPASAGACRMWVSAMRMGQQCREGRCDSERSVCTGSCRRQWTSMLPYLRGQASGGRGGG